MRRIALVVGIALASPVHADVDPARVEAARAEVLTDEYQPTLPGADSASDTRLRLGPMPDGRGRRYVDTRDLERDEPGPMSQLAAWLLWGIVIVGVGLIALWIATELLRGAGDDAAVAQDAAAPAAPDLAVIERPLGDAEELARRGEFREAIHTLLLRTLQELARTASVRIAPAMTSREILGRVPLRADAHDALAGLITAVELTHFGGDRATEADYLRCRAQFQLFAAAFRGRA